MKAKGGSDVFKPLTDGRFKFRCHKDIPCFTKCCAALSLILTPYDVLRLKSRLNMGSSEFLERYTDTSMSPGGRFPVVRLRMNQEDGRCPFVTPHGCSIYEDRPGACRIYPVGRATRADGTRGAVEKYFLVQESHCMGFQEDREWTIEEWIANEGLTEYNEMDGPWLEIVTSSKSLGDAKDLPRKLQMFQMVSYNLDRFREFLFNSRFFDLFEVEEEHKGLLASDDRALLRFGYQWLKFSLFGEKTITVKGQSF